MHHHTPAYLAQPELRHLIAAMLNARSSFVRDAYLRAIASRLERTAP